MLLKDSKNILCAVSSGYSSIIMAINMKKWYPYYNIVNVMANTSREHDASLVFMDLCDKIFGLNLVWIEADISQEKGVGTNYKIVDFENLKTKGEIFESGIKKYGIPSKVNKWCTRELKLNPLNKFAKDYFNGESYSNAVGIRADELDRVSKNYKENNIFYPLLDNGINTRLRNRFWHNEDIKLSIPAYKSNCKKCFEKSDRKLFTIIKEETEDGIIDTWELDMERLYSDVVIEGKENYNSYIENMGGTTSFVEIDLWNK